MYVRVSSLSSQDHPHRISATSLNGPQDSFFVASRRRVMRQFSYLWLVGNGGMGTIISTITTILPFPTIQR